MTRALINTTSPTSPVAIPAAFEPKKSPVPETPSPNESFERAISEDDAARRDHELEGGGKPRTS